MLIINVICFISGIIIMVQGVTNNHLKDKIFMLETNLRLEQHLFNQYKEELNKNENK